MLLLLLFAPNVKGKWVDSNFQIIDLLVPPLAAGVAGTLIFVHIANFATLQPWLHVGSFTCRILIHCIHTRDPYFDVPLRDTELCIQYTAACDTVDHIVLFNLLEHSLGISGPARSLLKSYLYGRSQCVQIDGITSEFADLTCGVPQGSVLGPSNFCMYMYPLGSILRHNGINYHI